MIIQTTHLTVIEEQIDFVHELVRHDKPLAEVIYQFPRGYERLSLDVVAFYLGQLPEEHRAKLESLPNWCRLRLQKEEAQHWLYQLLSYGEALSNNTPAIIALQKEKPLAYIEEVRGIVEADRMARDYDLSLEQCDVQDLQLLSGWHPLAMRKPDEGRDHILAVCVQADRWYVPFDQWKYSVVVCWCPLWLRSSYGEPIALKYIAGKNYD